MAEKTCSTCKFAEQFAVSAIDAPRNAHGDCDHMWDDEDPNEPIWLFRCRRFPPQFTGISLSNIINSRSGIAYPDPRHPNCWDYPTVTADDYCGEYKNCPPQCPL